MSHSYALPKPFEEWLSLRADGLDNGAEPAAGVLPQLTGSGVASVGVPVSAGGAGGDIGDAIVAVASVARHSLAASFMLWGHRTYIEYLLQSANRDLAERQLPDLLAGRVAGATALSNAMKFLAGIEALQISARPDGNDLVLAGKMAWVTNLRPAGFHVAAAVEREDGGPAFIVALSHDDEGIERSDDLDLMGMRSSDTAAVAVDQVRVDQGRVIASDAIEWLARVRPAFAGLQCGMSIGLARRSIEEAISAAGTGRGVLAAPLDELRARLDAAETALLAGVRSRKFEANPVPLFELRIELAEIAAEAVSLELQAAGGRAYLTQPGRDFARRWREAAFIPIITPSLVQLRTVLAQKRNAA